MTSEAREIARKLGRAQKQAILALPSDGSWGQSHNHAAAKRIWYRDDIPRLIDHKHCTDDCWALRPLGLAVRAELERQEQPK